MDQRQLDLLPKLQSLKNNLAQLPGFRQLVEAHQQVTASLQNRESPDQRYHTLLVEQEQSVSQLGDLLNKINETEIAMGRMLSADIQQLVPGLLTVDWYEQNLGTGEDSRRNWTISDRALMEIAITIGDPYFNIYPAAVINCQHDTLVDALIAHQWLYLVDTNRLILERQLDRVPELGFKLRTHVIDWFHNIPLDPNVAPGASQAKNRANWGLPDGQLGVIVAWNIFEYLTRDIMLGPLQHIRSKLRPGGMFIFSIMNAESDSVPKMIADRQYAYMTRSLLEQVLAQADLILDRWEPVSANDQIFILAKAPGDLNTAMTQQSKGLVRRS